MGRGARATFTLLLLPFTVDSQRKGSILEAHGGRLWATANLPNGATFPLPCR